MRTVIASANPDLTIALQFALRNEPGFDVIASVTACDGLAAVSSSSTIDLFVIDGALPLTAATIRSCKRAGPLGRPATIAVLAAGDDAVDDADVVVRKGGAPSELLDALRRIRGDRRRLA